MSIPLILLIVAVIIFIISFFNFNDEEVWGVGILAGFFLGFFSVFACCIDSHTTQTWPVSYKAYPTEKEIHVYVDNSDLHFSSDAKYDFDLWTANKPGFVTKGYNSFGVEVENTFSVK
jgi:hypothetical protein